MNATPKFAALVLTLSMIGYPVAGHCDDPLVIIHDGKYGYIDSDGRVLIPPQYLWASGFADGLGAVYVCGRTVSIDAAGKLLPLQRGGEGTALLPRKSGNNFGFVDASGNFVVQPQFQEVLPFSDGLAAVRLHDKWGFIDETGRVVIQPRFDEAYYFHEGVAAANLNDTPLIIDKTGKVLARDYEQLTGVEAEGRIPVRRGFKYGYLDLKGAIAIPLIFDDTQTFSEGLAPVKKGDKWGYLDLRGVPVIPFVFDSAGVFGRGLAPARAGSKSGFIDHSGQFVFTLTFRDAAGFWSLEGGTNVTTFWTDDDAFGYVNTSGKVIWGPTKEMPDHAPLLGWTEHDRAQSCIGIPDEIRRLVESFPGTD